MIPTPHLCRRPALVVAVALSFTACAAPGPAGSSDPAAAGSPLAAGAGSEGAWEHFAARYDADGDQRITAAEHGRGAAPFKRLDRNHDGVLTRADLEILPERMRGRNSEGALVRCCGPLGRCADTDDDGVVSQSDWQLFGDRLCKDGVLDRAVFGTLGLEPNRAPFVLQMLDTDQDMAVSRAEVDALFDRLDLDGDGRLAEVEFGIDDMPRAPQEGTLAPDFELPAVADPSSTIRLSSFRGDRPVALIFGSYT